MNYHVVPCIPEPVSHPVMSRDLMSHSHSFPKIALHPLPPQIYSSRTSCSQELLVRSVEGVKFPCLLFSYLTSIVVVLAFSINAILEYESISCLTTESIHDMCQSNKVNCIKSGGLVRFELLYCWDFCIFTRTIDVWYLTRHIYAGQKSGDRINGWTIKWGFFQKIPKFRTPN